MSIQKRAWLIVACCLLFADEGLAQEELPGPRWGVAQDIDEITDEKRIHASLEGQTVEISSPSLSFEDYQRNKGFTSTIRISCGPVIGLSVQITAPDNRPVSRNATRCEASVTGQRLRDTPTRSDGPPVSITPPAPPSCASCVFPESPPAGDQHHFK